jgi:hypothetical protein
MEHLCMSRLRTERATLQQAVAAATWAQEALKEAVTQLHMHGEIPASARDHLLGVLDSTKGQGVVAHLCSVGLVEVFMRVHCWQDLNFVTLSAATWIGVIIVIVGCANNSIA